MFLCALQLYIKTGKPGGGNEYAASMTPYDSQFLRDRLRDKAYLPMAYFEGAMPQNNYTPTQPYVLHVLPDPAPPGHRGRYIRVFLKNGRGRFCQAGETPAKGRSVVSLGSIPVFSAGYGSPANTIPGAENRKRLRL